MPADPGTLLTTTEVARRLRCSEQHVRALIRIGVLPGVNVGSSSRKRYRVAPDALAAFLGRPAAPLAGSTPAHLS